MKISLISDTHFEFYRDPNLFNNESNADVLVIAGDLDVGSANVIKSLKHFALAYENVVYILGNHESYGSSLAEVSNAISAATRNANIHFLNPGFVRLGDVTFLGGCLWTNFRKDGMAKHVCARNINDFYRIKGFNTDQCSLLHTEHMTFIQEAYSQLPGKKIIVTHFLPCTESIAPEYQGPDLLNYYFANDYGDYISTLKDTTWMFGHSHTKTDIMLGDTRLVANPYGYNKNNDYKECIIEV